MESYSVTQMMPLVERRALLDEMEAFARDHFDNEVVRPLVVTLTTGRSQSVHSESSGVRR